MQTTYVQNVSCQASDNFMYLERSLRTLHSYPIKSQSTLFCIQKNPDIPNPHDQCCIRNLKISCSCSSNIWAQTNKRLRTGEANQRPIKSRPAQTWDANYFGDTPRSKWLGFGELVVIDLNPWKGNACTSCICRPN